MRSLRKNNKFKPWLWAIDRPKLNFEQRKNLLLKAEHEKSWRRITASFFRVFFIGIFFVIIQFFNMGIYELFIKGNVVNHAFMVFLALLAVIIGFCLGCLFFAFLIRITNFVDEDTLEFIMRGRPVWVEKRELKKIERERNS